MKNKLKKGFVSIIAMTAALAAMPLPAFAADGAQALPAPENLSWWEIRPEYATFTWDHSDLVNETDKFVFCATWSNGTGEAEETGWTSYSGDKEIWLDFADFMAANGEGNYSVSANVTAKEGSAYIDSETVSLDEVHFSQMTLVNVTLDKDGNPVEDIYAGGEVDIQSEGYSIYSYSDDEQNDEIYVFPDGFSFTLVPEKNLGYVFEGFTFEEDHTDLNGATGDTGLTMNKSFKVTATFREVPGTATVSVDLGEKHKELAPQVAEKINKKGEWPYDVDPKASAVYEGSRVIITISNGGASEYDAYEYAALAVRYTNNDGGFKKHEGEEIYSSYAVAKGTFDDYETVDELKAEWEEAKGKTFSDNTDLNALWRQKATDAAITLAAPKCGTVVSMEPAQEGDAIGHQLNHPVVTIDNGHFSFLSIYKDGTPYAYWIKSGDAAGSDGEGKNYEGTIKGGESYRAEIGLTHTFKYYIANDAEYNITVNGEKAEVKPGVFLMATAQITAEHDWDEWTVTKEATATQEGEEMHTCLGCGKKETRVIPKVEPEESDNEGEDSSDEKGKQPPDNKEEQPSADKTKKANSGKNAASPQTGDADYKLFFIVLAGAAAAVITGIVASKVKER